MKANSVLIVEDEKIVATTLGKVLARPENGGFQVTHARSGEEALVLLATREYALLITDQHLPGITGLELIQKISAGKPNMRSLLITGYGSLDIQESALRYANAYLAKPFTPEIFIETIKQTLEAKQPVKTGAIVFSKTGLHSVQKRIETMRQDLGAAGAMLVDRNGQVLAEAGMHDDFDTTALLTVLGDAMAASNRVCDFLQDETSFDVHYHEGKFYELFAARITHTTFFVLLMDRRASNAAGRFGMVWMSLRRAVTELRGMLDQTDETAHQPNDAADTIADSKKIAPESKPTPPPAASTKIAPPAPDTTRASKNSNPVSAPTAQPENAPPPSPRAPEPVVHANAQGMNAPETPSELPAKPIQTLEHEADLFSAQNLEAAAAALEQTDLPARAADFSEMPTLTFEQARALGLFNSNLPGQE